MADSSRAPTARKTKPKNRFPLFKHARGYWAKKHKGKLFYFGKAADDPEGEKALVRWGEVLTGRRSHGSGDSLTVEDLCDFFVNSKKPRIATGELTGRTYSEYEATCQRLIDTFGQTRLVDDLRPEDFETLRAKIAKQWGPVRLANEIQRVRSVFKWGFESQKLDKPMRFGPDFRKPSRGVMRKTRAAKGSKMIEAADLRKLIALAGVPLKCMILLALNGGLGNNDIGNLPISAIDFEQGWIRYPRPKTGVERRFPLWPETVKALKAAAGKRPAPKPDHAKGLVFVTKYGRPWAKDVADSPVTKEFRKLLGDLSLHRPGVGFYSLRHVFATISGESKDQPAVDHIMGHAREDMASIYRERISDERLKAVVDHVHAWLFPPKPAKRNSRGKSN